MSTSLRRRSLAALVFVILGIAFASGGCGGRQGPPDVILIVLDTVRDDHTAVGGPRRALTPALAEFAEGATVFTNAWATAPWTPPSHASMFTGMLPAEHGCTHRYPRLDPSLTTLPQLMTRAGYETAAFYSNPWLSERTTGLCRDFDVTEEAPPRGGLPGDKGSWQGDQGGRATNMHVRRWLEDREGDRPLFLFVNFLEAHDPYDPAPAVRRRLLPRADPKDAVDSGWILQAQAGLHPAEEVAWNRVRGLYAGDVATSDALLHSLLRNLSEMGVADDAVVIVTSDHGENLGEHGLVSHQFSVHETLLAVPLVIRAPGRLRPGTRDDPVMLTDLFATVLEAAGVEVPPERPFSRSLLGPPLEEDRPLLAEYSQPSAQLLDAIEKMNPQADLGWRSRTLSTIRVGDMRLTVADDGWQQLHDVVDDPGQEVDLSAAWPRVAVALHELMNSLLAGRFAPTGEVEIDAATREQLRSLGYVQ